MAMALEHALLVSLSERPATGIELTRRFDRSIGFFWSATHQQIYKVLKRMEADGWVQATQGGTRSTERHYSVTAAGNAALADWIAAPTPRAGFRSDLAVKMRGASYGDRQALQGHIRSLLADHHLRLAHYEQLEKQTYPEPEALTGQELDTWLVLRGGLKQEQFWIEWLTEYLEAHARTTAAEAAPQADTEQ